MEPVNEETLAWTELDHDETTFRRKKLSENAAGQDLGCSLYELPPGCRSWPYHYHTGNEEALFVLAGTGRLRGSDEAVPLSAGDYVGFPADRSGGHQVINDSGAVLRYLMISTMNEPDVTVYPDSGKFGVFVGVPPGGHGDRSLHGYYKIADDVEYWTQE